MTETNPPEPHEETINGEQPVDDIKISPIAGLAPEHYMAEKSTQTDDDSANGDDAIRHKVSESKDPQALLKAEIFNKPWGRNLRGVIEYSPGYAVAAEWTFAEPIGSTSVQTAKRGSLTLYPGNKVAGGDLVRFFMADRAPRHGNVVAVLTRPPTVIEDYFQNTINCTFPAAQPVTSRISALNILTRESDGDMFIQLGNTKTTTGRVPGFELFFSARNNTTPEDNGQIGIMQFLRCTINYFMDNGAAHTIGTGGNWYLDKFPDRPSLLYGTTTEKTILHGATAIAISMDDSPFIKLFSNVRRLEFNYTFRTYLVYKNQVPDSRWAPLYGIQWGFSGKHAKEGTIYWPKTFREAPVVFKGAALPTDDLPEWVEETGILGEQISKLIQASAKGDMQPEEWKRPAQPSRQMTVITSAPKSPQIMKAIQEATSCNIGGLSYGANTIILWTSPERANEAKKVPGVARVEELSREGRYTPKPEKLPAESEFIIYVAPFFLYNDTEANMAFAMATSPKSLEEVGAELVNIARLMGINGAVATVRSFSLLNFVFPAPVTNENILRTMTDHPQVNYIQRKSSHVTDDDPIKPVS